jgi:MafB19-like deaminase
LRANIITGSHAEADSFQQALNAGARGGDGVLYVDRPLCLACGQNGGVRSMAKKLELDTLIIVTPKGKTIIWP